MTDPVTFFREVVPSEWFVEPVDVTVDRDEILVAGCLASGAGDSTLTLRLSGDLSRFEGRGIGAGMLLPTSPRRSARNC